MAIFPNLEDDEGAYGLTEDWNEVEWACHQHDARPSATTWPAHGGERRMVRDFASPPTEESSSRSGSVELDIEALVREAYEIVGAQMAAGREPGGDAREGVEHATLSSCGEWTAMEADNYGFGTWQPETSSEEETSGGSATFHTPVQDTPAAGPSAHVTPREKNGGGGKAGNRDNGKETVEEEFASILEACVIEEEIATVCCPWDKYVIIRK